jgi:hypothetical protein
MAKTITIGGPESETTVKVGRFKGFKATEMLAHLADLYEQVPDIERAMDDFERQYERNTVVRVPRAYYEARSPEDAKNVSEEAWQASGGVIELPGAQPGLERTLMHVFPMVMKLARRRMFDILALAICPNSDLEQFDLDDEADKLYGKDGVLKPFRDQLLHEAEPQELFELAAAVVDVVKDQFSGQVSDGGGLGKLGAALPLLGALFGPDDETSDQEDDESKTKPSSSAQSSSSRSRSRSQGGDGKKSSTGSRGAKSTASAAS